MSNDTSISKTLTNPKTLAAIVSLVIILAGTFGVVSQNQVNISLNQINELTDKIDSLSQNITTLQNQLDQPVGSTLSASRKTASFVISFATNYGVPDYTLVLQSGVNGSMVTLGSSATNYTYIAEKAINAARVFNGSIYFCEGNYVTQAGINMTVPTIPAGVTVTFDSGAYGYILGTVNGNLADWHNSIFMVAGQTEQAPYSYLIYQKTVGVTTTYYAKAVNGSISWSSTDQTGLQDTVLSAVTSGEIRLNEVAFDLALMNSIPSGVQVVSSVGSQTLSFCNSSDAKGGFTIEVGSGQTVNYYTAKDSTNKICYASTNTNTTITSALASGAKVEVTKGSYPNTYVSLTNGSSLTIQKGATGITALPSYQLTATLIDYERSIIKEYINGQVIRTQLGNTQNGVLNNNANTLPTITDYSLTGTYDPVDICFDEDRGVLVIVGRVVPSVCVINATTFSQIQNISLPITLQPYRIKYDGINYWISTGCESGTPTYKDPAGLIKVNPDTLAYESYLFPDDYAHQFGNALEIVYSPTNGKEYIFVGLGSTDDSWACKVAKFDPLNFTEGYCAIVDTRNTGVGNYASQVRELIDSKLGYIWAFGDMRPAKINVDTLAFTYGSDIGANVFSGCRGSDSYLYVGLANGTLLKINPSTGVMGAPLVLDGSNLVHHIQAIDNGFIFAVSWGHPAIAAYYINEATLTEYATPQTYTTCHGLAYDGINIYVAEFASELYATPYTAVLHRFPALVPDGGTALVLP